MRTEKSKFLPRCLCVAMLACVAPGVAQEESPPPERAAVEARVQAVLAEHAGGDLREALARLDGLVGAEGVDPAPIRASRFRLRVALGEREAAAEDLRWLLESGAPGWKAWARERAEELRGVDPGIEVGTADVPERLRYLVELLQDAARRNSSEIRTRQADLRTIGGPAVPALIEGVEEALERNATEEIEALVETIAAIDDPRAISWLSAALSGELDPVLAREAARSFDEMPQSTRGLLVQRALESGVPSAQLQALSYRHLPFGERELAILAAHPDRAASIVTERDPGGTQGIQRAVLERIGGRNRITFARDLAYGDRPIQVDPQLLPDLIVIPDVAASFWSWCPPDLRRAHSEIARKILEDLRRTPSDEVATYRYRTAGWKQVLNDAVTFDWVDLVDAIVPLCAHPNEAVSRSAREALAELAPVRLIEADLASGRSVSWETFSLFGTREQLERMVEIVVAGFPMEPVFDRVVKVATAADREQVLPIHRAFAAASSYPSAMREAWHAWLSRHAAAWTVAEILAFEPHDRIVCELAARRATTDDVPRLVGAVRGLVRDERSESRVANLLDALLRLDATEAVRDLAASDVAVLAALRDTSFDRLALWREWLVGAPAPAVIVAAMRDPQVATDDALVDTVLAAVAADDDVSVRWFETFLARIPEERVQAFARQLWKVARADLQNDRGSERALAALRSIGARRDPAGIPLLAEGIAVDDARLQLEAVSQLTRTFSPLAVPHLIAALRSDHESVAEAANRGLERLDRYFRASREWRERFQELEIPWPENAAEAPPAKSGDGR